MLGACRKLERWLSGWPLNVLVERTPLLESIVGSKKSGLEGFLKLSWENVRKGELQARPSCVVGCPPRLHTFAVRSFPPSTHRSIPITEWVALGGGGTLGS